MAKNKTLVEENSVEEEAIQEEDIELNLDDMSDRKIGEKLEKINLDGATTVITRIQLIAKPEVKKTLKGTVNQRSVVFRVYYDIKNDMGYDVYENYGGVSQFEREDGSFGEPTIWAEGESASAKLFKLWLKKIGKKPEEVSFKEFFKSLVGMPVSIVRTTEKYQGKSYPKNTISSFL